MHNYNCLSNSWLAVSDSVDSNTFHLHKVVDMETKNLRFFSLQTATMHSAYSKKLRKSNSTLRKSKITKIYIGFMSKGKNTQDAFSYTFVCFCVYAKTFTFFSRQKWKYAVNAPYIFVCVKSILWVAKCALVFAVRFSALKKVIFDNLINSELI